MERQFQLITEAAARLGDQADALCPGANWRDIRAFGNVLRHAYDRLDPVVLKTVLDDELPVLEKLVSAALVRIGERD